MIESIAIDVNVFQHADDPRNNDGHIDALFYRLYKANTRILVDNRNKIWAEYERNLPSYIKNTGEGLAQRVVIKHLLGVDNLEIVHVDLTDNLMSAVEKVVFYGKDPDRFYVYVAFKKGKYLVTNDLKDIVNKWKDLKKETKRIRANGAGILTSRDAHATFLSESGEVPPR